MSAPTTITETVGRYTLVIDREAGRATISGKHHTLIAGTERLRGWIDFYKRLSGKKIHGPKYSDAVKAHQRALELLEASNGQS